METQSRTRLLTVAEVADFYRLTERSIRRMAARGDLVKRQVGHTVRFADHEVRAAMGLVPPSRPRRRRRER